MALQGSSQADPECVKFYKTNDLISSTNEWHEKEKKGTVNRLKKMRHIN